jgi:serine phosphatase RsbU (regulator of sigma subunit)
MVLATNLWDDTNMMALAERMQDRNRNAPVKRPWQAASAVQEVSAQALAASGGDLAENAQFLSDELNALRRDHAKLQQAIFEAAQVQRKLCAPRELSWGQLEIAGEIFPVRHLSGDFFKVMKLGSALGVVLGDIAGKGLTAGIWQAHVMGLMQRSARRHSDPGEAVAEVNQELCLDGGPPLTALFFARVAPRTNEVVYCNAGLPAPLLLRDKMALERLEKGGPMLGAMEQARFETGSVKLNAGDMLVAYSDGVTECRNTADEEFEVERLAAAAMAVNGTSATKALFSLLGTVLDFADSCSPGDDMTVLIVRRRDAIKGEQGNSRGKDFSSSHRRPSSGKRPRSADRGGPSSK